MFSLACVISQFVRQCSILFFLSALSLTFVRQFIMTYQQRLWGCCRIIFFVFASAMQLELYKLTMFLSLTRSFQKGYPSVGVLDSFTKVACLFDLKNIGLLWSSFLHFSNIVSEDLHVETSLRRTSRVSAVKRFALLSWPWGFATFCLSLTLTRGNLKEAYINSASDTPGILLRHMLQRLFSPSRTKLTRSSASFWVFGWWCECIELQSSPLWSAS